MQFELNEESAEQLRYLLANTAWNGFFVQHLEQWRADAIASLLDPSEQRQKNYSDDYLRASVAIIDSLLRVGPTELEAWDASTRENEEQRTREQAYDDAADLGVYRPSP